MLPVWEKHSYIYAILDAARNESIYKMLMACAEEFTCLYNGDIPVSLARAAPYLIKLPTDSALFQKIYQQGFFDSWGIFFTSFDNSKELKRHFQSLLRVKTEDGRRLYFRYYDPRVLRVYLPTCTKDELRAVFGSVDNMWVAGETEDAIVEYRKESDRFFSSTIELKDLEI